MSKAKTSTSRALPVAFILGILVVIIDQLTKEWALATLADGHTTKLLGDFLGLRLTFNSGAAFSFLNNATWVFTVFAALFVVAVPYFMSRSRSRTQVLILGPVWGGALGNLIDRIVREPGFPNGHVVDMIKYGDWFIGNVADIALVLGLAALIVYEFFAEKNPTPGDTDADSAQGDAGEQSVHGASEASTETVEQRSTRD